MTFTHSAMNSHLEYDLCCSRHTQRPKQERNVTMKFEIFRVSGKPVESDDVHGCWREYDRQDPDNKAYRCFINLDDSVSLTHELDKLNDENPRHRIFALPGHENTIFVDDTNPIVVYESLIRLNEHVQSLRAVLQILLEDNEDLRQELSTLRSVLKENL